MRARIIGYARQREERERDRVYVTYGLEELYSARCLYGFLIYYQVNPPPLPPKPARYERAMSCAMSALWGYILAEGWYALHANQFVYVCVCVYVDSYMRVPITYPALSCRYGRRARSCFVYVCVCVWKGLVDFPWGFGTVAGV